MSYSVDCRSAAASLLLKSALASLAELYALSTSDVTLAFKILCIPSDLKQFATFIAFTNQCLSVGQYALLYNKHIVDAIRSHSYDVLINMFKRGKLDVPEIFNNEGLTQEDVSVISELLEFDIESIVSYVLNYNPDLDTQVYSKETEYMSDNSEDVYLSTEAQGSNKFLQKCRNSICYRENKPYLPIGQESKIYTSVQQEGKYMSTITCVDIRRALYMIANDTGISDLNSNIIQSLHRTHYKEIAIYKYAISRGYTLPSTVN